VGKSTNLDVVCKFLEEKRIRFTVTREPGGTEIAERIRELLLSETTEIMDGLTELLLMFAARNQHLTRKILPELDQGLWVVSDRFTDASYAYQAFGRSIAIEKVDTLRRLVQDGFNPDLTLLLDVEPDVSRGRISDRELDRIEKENLEFYQRVRAGYLDLAEKLERIKLIDASKDLESVGAEIRRHMSEFISSLNHDFATADR
jgi:dTMP kinase